MKILLIDDDAHLTAPILMLTGQTEIPQKVNALDAGADDFLIKTIYGRGYKLDP